MEDDDALRYLSKRRRRRRRRRLDKPPISARLILDSRANSSHVLLSADLCQELFPGLARESDSDSELDLQSHVAIAPWFPVTESAPKSIVWTIAQAAPRNEEHQQHSTIWASGEATFLQYFSKVLQEAGSIGGLRQEAAVEIRIVEVMPIYLDTIFVRMDRGLQKDLESKRIDPNQAWDSNSDSTSRKRTGNGRVGSFSNGNTTQQVDADGHHPVTTAVVRKALRGVPIVHSGNYLPLPLPSHPVTHALPPPAKIIHCEPVSQGRIGPSTRIVVTTTEAQRPVQKLSKAPLNPHSNQIAVEDPDDTSDDRFYSAAEDRSHSVGPSSPESETLDHLSNTDSSTSLQSRNSEDDSSDGSLDDLITLSAPTLAISASTLGSIRGQETPRDLGRGPGIVTPGSVVSNFTSATARADGKQGRLFKAQPLDQPVVDDFLHPKPSPEEDDEARVYVDVASLGKIGCFSGDWVKIEPEIDQNIQDVGSWGLAFQSVEEKSMNWRALKIFGLPEIYSARQRRPMISPDSEDARPVSSSRNNVPAPQAFFPPLILANMKPASHFRLSPLPSGYMGPEPVSNRVSRLKAAKMSSQAGPPLAREVKLEMIVTPLSTDRSVQSAIWTALKQYFERKQRILKTGDLIAIPFDEKLGRLLHSSSPPTENESDDLIFSQLLASTPHRGSGIKATDIAWFRVGSALSEADSKGSEVSQNDHWNHVVQAEASETRLKQSGTAKSRLPPVLESSWQTYYGPNVRRTAISRTDLQSKRNKIAPLHGRLREMFAAYTTPRALHLGLKPLAVLLTSTQRNIGKATVVQHACADLGLHVFEIDAYEIVSESSVGGGDVKTEAFLKARSERASSCGAENYALLIRHIEALSAERIVATLQEILDSSRVLVATTTEVEKLPDSLRGLFSHELEMTAPDEGEREGLLRSVARNKDLLFSPDLDLASVAVKTAALVAGDLADVVDRAVIARQCRLEGILKTALKHHKSLSGLAIQDVHIAGGPQISTLIQDDFTIAVDAARKNFADSIGAPKIPNVSWDDVGGLTHVKDAVIETIQLPLERPELFAKGMKKRSGILFYGPPGTGKTLLAKAIATEFSLNFFSVKGPELLNMYIGESEANVRRVFQRARDARPCVIFFDELDSVAPKRGNQGDSGGVMDRIVSQILAELDGMSGGDDGGGGVFVIGATNRPDLLDAALLRPGRFDKMLYLGISDTHEKQLTILEALTRKFSLHPSLSLRSFSEKLPFTYTGADLYALCSDAMLKAITRQAASIDDKIAKIPGPALTTAQFFDHHATHEDVAVMVTEIDFVEAQKELIGSVSAKELDHYRAIQKSFEGDDKTRDAGRTETARSKRATTTLSFATSNDKQKNGSSLANGKPPFKHLHAKVKGKAKKKAIVNGADENYCQDPSADDSELICTAGATSIFVSEEVLRELSALWKCLLEAAILPPRDERAAPLPMKEGAKEQYHYRCTLSIFISICSGIRTRLDYGPPSLNTSSAPRRKKKQTSIKPATSVLQSCLTLPSSLPSVGKKGMCLVTFSPRRRKPRNNALPALPIPSRPSTSRAPTLAPAMDAVKIQLDGYIHQQHQQQQSPTLSERHIRALENLCNSVEALQKIHTPKRNSGGEEVAALVKELTLKIGKVDRDRERNKILERADRRCQDQLRAELRLHRIESKIGSL
ncbi:MAG: peroxisomal assembly protein [Vezdaea aestivalis]|nr:MAG: peroxisomal assembly protein [Vezdaea aestivalis]